VRDPEDLAYTVLIAGKIYNKAVEPGIKSIILCGERGRQANEKNKNKKKP